ncbi:MAG: glycosyl hydrolase family 28-related protein [Acholeplasmataceae bacterium]|jgi:hypothetical protein
MKKIVIMIMIFLSLMFVGKFNIPATESNVNFSPEIIADDDSYETVIIADAIVTSEPFNADPTGISDSTNAIKDAITQVSKNGGGTVYLPEGKYRITSSITIDNYVTLIGKYKNPDLNEGYGTIIIADIESSIADLPGLFRLRGSSGVVGLTIWYPRQTIKDVRPFPYTFEIMGGAYTILEHMQFTIQNVTLINSYKGVAASRTINPNIKIGIQDAHENLVIENLKGTPLKYGLNIVNESDIGYYKNIHFSPKYWSEAIELGGPNYSDIREYTYNQACGLVLGDLEWSPYYDITVSGYKTGVHIIKGTRIQEELPIAFMGGFYKLNVNDCYYGLIVDELFKGWGMLVTKSSISSEKVAVANNADVGYVRLTNVNIEGDLYGERIYINEAITPEVVIETPQINRPAKRLFNVMDYGVVADGHEECSLQIQQALDNARDAGGGIVYLPAGYYKISQPLKVYDGVQLRGCVPVANRDTLGKSEGTIIFSYYDKDSETNLSDNSFITLGNNAGLYGLRICYPNNNLWLISEDTYHINRSAFTVNLKGDGAYCCNVGLVNSYNGIRVEGNNTVVKNVPSLFFNYGIYIDGANNVHVENVFSNATVATQSGLQQKFPDLFKNGWMWRISHLWNYYTYTEKNTKIFEVVDSQNVNIMSVFTFCSARILKATNSEVTMNGCGADRMWQDGIVVDLNSSNLIMINQLKYHCMMFNIDENSKINIYGRMNLILGNVPSIHDVEHNMVNNLVVRDINPILINKKVSVLYDEIEWVDKPSTKNPLNDILNDLR